MDRVKRGVFMTKRSHLRLSYILLVIVISSQLFFNAPFAYAATTEPDKPLVEAISHYMKISIVLIGFDSKFIDVDYLKGNLEYEIHPILQAYEISHGSVYHLVYDIITADQSFTSELEDFLASITRVQHVPKFLDSHNDTDLYAVIDALSTEDWLHDHSDEFGGIPSDGYTLLIANMSDLSSHYHYYSIEYYDLDGYSKKAKYYNAGVPGISFPIVNWMFSWGGRYRFYYIDLSAGDPEYDYSGTGHIPMQCLEYENRTLTRTSITEYVSDYAAEAVRNLFAPSYCYSPTYSMSYDISILLFDNTSRITSSNYTEVINPSLIKSAFENLVPNSSWNVELTFKSLRDDPGLYSIIEDSVVYDNWTTGYEGDKLHVVYFDYRPIYYYLLRNFHNYVDTSGEAVVLPVFCFVFSSAGNLGATWKEYITSPSRCDPSGLWGVALPEMALISHSERDIFAWGYCLSHVVIHEVGHMMGLMHPFSYGLTEDYVSSAMAYSPYEYNFSVFDRDAIKRGHEDLLRALSNAEVERTAELIRGILLVSVGLVVGIVISSAFWLWYSKRIKAAPPTFPPYPPRPIRRYCTQCGAEIPPFAVYCPKCGAKQERPIR